MRRVGRGWDFGGEGQGACRAVEVVQRLSQVRRRGREVKAEVGIGGAAPMEGYGEGGEEGCV